jgi:predicted ATP-dependent serine protease
MSSIKEDVIKTFGEDIILSGNSVVDKKVLTIPLSPSLDIVLNGGIPEGSFVVLTGQPKCGKTTTSLDFAATAQKPEYQGALPKH